MAVQHDTNGKDDLKTQFITREGTYRLMTLSEYSRPSRVGYQSNQNSPQVRVSIVSLPNAPVLLGGQTSSTQTVQQQIPTTSSSIVNNGQEPINSIQGGDRICFNYGKEIFVYAYRGIKKAADLSKQIDKKIYKGTNPSCHDFNAASATLDGAPLLVGFTTGQIQLVQPGRREPGKLYNEERLIDKTKVTCLKWLPGSTNLFLASHASGHLYLYNEELPCTPTAPTYQPFKIGDGYTILTCKTKSTRNPLYKWTFGSDNLSINEFSFSPCGSNLAVVSQDGFLRVFHYDTMELIGLARSYFGGFLCVCWSPDGKYIVVGGEDDLVTVWSLNEKRVVARGQGHRSWVSVVAFDPFTTSYSNWDGPDFSDDENTMNISENYNNHSNYDDRNGGGGGSSGCGDAKRRPLSSCTDKLATSYRLGSVSQDTQLCLWDITEDVLRQPINFRHRLSSYDPHPTSTSDTKPQSPKNGIKSNDVVTNKFNSLKKNSTISSGSNANEVVGSVRGFYNIGDSNSDVTIIEKPIINNTTTKISSTVNNLENNKNILMGNNNSKIKNKTDNQIIGNCVGNNNLTKIDSPDSSTNTITKTSTSSKSSDSSITSSVGCGSGSGVGYSGGGGAGGVGSTSGGGSGGGGSGSGISAFNTLTQKLSNFSFGSDKNKTPQSDSSSSSLSFSQNHNHHNNNNNNHNNNKKMFLLSSKSNNYNINNLNNNINSSSIDNSTIDKNNSKNLLTTYDPMRLIGTSACPRFDECPVLEPLVCKKIAHERLTALIFREDCFLTACQDGFIYTWARPGSNHPQHMALNPSSQPQNSAAV